MTELLPMPPLPSVSQQSYERTVWPALERGVESLLLPDAFPQSHEVLYRAVHNACCCGLAQRIETDLLACIARHSSAIARRLPPRGDGLAGMHHILGPILVVFAYLDREYLSGGLEPCMTQLVLQQMHASPSRPLPQLVRRSWWLRSRSPRPLLRRSRARVASLPRPPGQMAAPASACGGNPVPLDDV